MGSNSIRSVSVEEALTSDILVLIAASLSVRDLSRLACAGPRFSLHKCITVAGEALCIVDAAARRQVEGAPIEEQEWMHRRGTESWRRILRELEALRAPLTFTRVHHSIVVDEGGSRATKPGDVDEQDFGARCALGSQIMRAGKHFVQLTDCSQAGMGSLEYCVRPADWDPQGEGDTVRRFPRYGEALSAWYSVDYESRAMPSDNLVIGLLLDLDVGSFSVYQKRGVRRTAEGQLLLPSEEEAVWHRAKSIRGSRKLLPLTRFSVDKGIDGECISANHTIGCKLFR